MWNQTNINCGMRFISFSCFLLRGNQSGTEYKFSSSTTLWTEVLFPTYLPFLCRLVCIYIHGSPYHIITPPPTPHPSHPMTYRCRGINTPTLSPLTEVILRCVFYRFLDLPCRSKLQLPTMEADGPSWLPPLAWTPLHPLASVPAPPKSLLCAHPPWFQGVLWEEPTSG